MASPSHWRSSSTGFRRLDDRAPDTNRQRDDEPGATEPASRLVVALVRGVHGLRGAVRVEVLTDRPEERFVRGAVLFREGSDTQLTITSATAIPDGPGWRVQFREVADRTAADTLRGAYLEAAAPPDALGRGEYYWHEVIGCEVTGVDGRSLGRVADIYRAGGAEVFVVRGGPVGEFDLPAVRAFVRIFAPRRGEIVIDADALDLRPPRRARNDRAEPEAAGDAATPAEPIAPGDADAPADPS
jgi:16S rRNA processing protein RimM